MRGVYATIHYRHIANSGSSPHARGLHGTTNTIRIRFGIIPACAGFTAGGTSASPYCGIIPACAGFTLHHWEVISASRDHPRMRGVYRSSFHRVNRREGSSPHARGLRHHSHADALEPGIIPACAGFTVQGRKKDDCEAGSSPHARGLRPSHRRSSLAGRIIPACAGFTDSRIIVIPKEKDHPRMRGVYSRLRP